MLFKLTDLISIIASKMGAPNRRTSPTTETVNSLTNKKKIQFNKKDEPSDSSLKFTPQFTPDRRAKAFVHACHVGPHEFPFKATSTRALYLCIHCSEFTFQRMLW